MRLAALPILRPRMIPDALRRLFDFQRTPLAQFGDEIAERSARLGAAYAALTCLGYGVVYAIVGPAEFVPANFTVALLMGLLARWPLRSATRMVVVVVNLALALLIFQTVMVGNLTHAGAAWIIVPSVSAIMIGMRRLGIYLVVVSSVALLGVQAAREAGALKPSVQLVFAEWQLALSMVGAQVLVLLIGLLILRARDRLVTEIRDRSHELVEALERESAARAEAEAARNEALAASRAKEQFFANLTHEIRTPLAGVMGAAALLERDAASTDSRPLVAALSASARELGEVVDAMLDHAKLSVGHFAAEPEPIDLAEMLESLRAMFADQAALRGLALRVELDPQSPGRVVCDRMALRRILINLLANALKFTDAGSVELRVRVQPAARGAVLTADVSDTGIGIASEHLATIFEAFVQADASITRRFGGTGLGLAISRRLAELLGGTLGVRSAPGDGSVFTLTMPVDLADDDTAPAPQPQRAAAGEVPARRVLVVEDNPINRLVAAEMLALLGSEVVLAEDGERALERLDGTTFDLILMDLQMPGMDGIAATLALRRRERDAGMQPTPVIALTGNSASDYGEACAQAGMNGFLVKPVSIEALEALLRSPPSGGDTAGVIHPSSRDGTIPPP